MRFTLWLIPILAVVLCARANAASIMNMDEVPRVFIVDVLGEQQEVTLRPWRKIEIASPTARIKMGDYVSEVLEPAAQYAIWPGKGLHRQRSGNLGGNFN